MRNASCSVVLSQRSNPFLGLVASGIAFALLLLSSAASWAQVNYVSWDFTPTTSSGVYGTQAGQDAARTTDLTSPTFTGLTLGTVTYVAATTFHRTTGWPTASTPSATSYVEFSVTLGGGQTFTNSTMTLLVSNQTSSATTAPSQMQITYGYGASPAFANAGVAQSIGTATTSPSLTIPAPGNSTTTKLTIRILCYNSTTATGNFRILAMALTGSAPLGGNTPPPLTAAVGVTVDNSFNVTFTDDPAWRAVITNVRIAGTILTAGSSVSAGQITFTPSASAPAGLLQTVGTKTITVQATGYPDTSVSQAIGFGAANKLGIRTQPTAPASNGGALAIQPVIVVQDQYGNTNTASSASVSAAVGAGIWTLGGSASTNASSGIATFTGLTATSTAAVTGATIAFTSAGLSNVTSTAFNIPAPAPTNDNPTGAITLVVDAPAVQGTFASSTPMTGATKNDVFYKFVATASTLAVTIDAFSVSGDKDLYVYSVMPTTYSTSLNVVGSGTGISTSNEVAAMSGLTVGSNYWILVQDFAGGGGTFDIRVGAYSIPGVLAGWNMTGLTSYGPSPMAPTYSDSGVTVVGLTRGSGVGTSGTAAGDAWGGVNWPETSTATAVASNRFATCTITPNAGKTTFYTAVSKLNYRRTSTGPTSGTLQYSTNGVSYIDITALSYPNTGTGGASTNNIDLTGIAALQGTTNTVTFRIVNYGASASTGPWYIFDVGSTSAHDFEITGTVSNLFTCPTITLSPSSPLTAGTVGTAYSVNITASGGATPYTYSVTNGVLPGGLTLDTAGLLSGTPTNAGTSTFSVRAADSNNCVGVQAYSLTINCPAIAPFNVTGGGAYCAGGSGVAVGLDGSETNVNYQLQVGNVNSGSPTAGTGNALPFGNQTIGGSYTVLAISGGCTNPMTGSATVTVTPTPSAPTAGSNSPVNVGDAINLTASTVSGATYDWTGPNGFASSSQNPSILSAALADAGTYYVTATVDGCPSLAASTDVVVNIAPPPEILLEVSSIVRQGNDITINWTGTGGSTNEVWSSSVVGSGYAVIPGSTVTLPGTGNVPTNYTDVGAASNPTGFYKVHLVQP